MVANASQFPAGVRALSHITSRRMAARYAPTLPYTLEVARDRDTRISTTAKAKNTPYTAYPPARLWEMDREKREEAMAGEKARLPDVTICAAPIAAPSVSLLGAFCTTRTFMDAEYKDTSGVSLYEVKKSRRGRPTIARGEESGRHDLQNDCESHMDVDSSRTFGKDSPNSQRAERDEEPANTGLEDFHRPETS